MRLLLHIAFLLTLPAQACINIEGATLDGTYEMVLDEYNMRTLRDRMNTKPQTKMLELEATIAKPNLTPDTKAEYSAIRDIFAGNYDTAIKQLLSIEESGNGDYGSAANLGTAYELSGNNREALRWITTSIERNEYSHYGTEWLHQRILETKISMEDDPDYLQSNSVLPIPELDHWDQNFVFPYRGQELDAHSLIKGFYYQLGERMVFVKPQDPIVADLLYNLAILEANSGVLEPAVEALLLAKEYGYQDIEAIEGRLTHYREIIDSTWKVNGRTVAAIAGPLLILLVAILISLVCLRATARWLHQFKNE